MLNVSQFHDITYLIKQTMHLIPLITIKPLSSHQITFLFPLNILRFRTLPQGGFRLQFQSGYCQKSYSCDEGLPFFNKDESHSCHTSGKKINDYQTFFFAMNPSQLTTFCCLSIRFLFIRLSFYKIIFP